VTKHVKETSLALFVSGDLSLFERAAVRLHLSGCPDCRARAEMYRFDRQRAKEDASQMPSGVDWDRLAQEMTANIRVGLAAGECVAPRARKQGFASSWGSNWGSVWGQFWAGSWRPAAAVAGVAMLLSAAWWLNLPSADTASLGRAFTRLMHGRQAATDYTAQTGASNSDDRGPVVEATSSRIELHENGNSLVMSPGVSSQGSTLPVSISINAQGAASASYVNDAGEITLTGVYVQ
jgi:hypothetical protein